MTTCCLGSYTTYLFDVGRRGGALSFIFVSCGCHDVAAGAHDVVALRGAHVASHLAAFLFCFYLLRRFGLVSRLDSSWQGAWK